MRKKNLDLVPLQKKTLELLARSPLGKKFYWTGGTALAYFYLHHRLSYDLDFFTDKPFSYEELLGFIGNLKAELRLGLVEQKKIFDRWEFLLHNHGETRLEFVHYNFKPLKPRRPWRGIRVDSLEDMAANKTMALIDRHEPKDAFDVYFLIKDCQLPPAKLLRLAEKKFGTSISPSQFWSEAIHQAHALRKLTPLLLGPREEKLKLLQSITEYFEKSAAKEVKRMIG